VSPASWTSRPHLKYVVGQQRGYTILDLTRDRLQADWWFVPSITERSDAETFGKGLMSEAAGPHLVEASGPSSSRPAPDFAP
jgi:alkaline phosphatase D